MENINSNLFDYSVQALAVSLYNPLVSIGTTHPCASPLLFILIIISALQPMIGLWV